MKKLLTFALLAAATAAQAQPALYNRGALYVSPGATVRVEGTLENGLGGQIDQEGSLYLTGDLLQRDAAPLFAGSDGQVLLDGTANQTVGGTGPISFANLELANAAGLTFGTSVDVRGDFRLTAGNADLNGQTVDLSTTGQLLNEAETRRVLGSSGTIRAERVLDAPAAAEPGGLGLFVTSANNLGATVVERGHAPQTNLEGNQGVARYYVVTPANNGALDATLRFHYFDAELNGMAETDLAAYESAAGATWEPLPAGTNNTASNFVEMSGLNELAWLTLSDSVTDPLPVELLMFEAEASRQGTVWLTWTTASELNNDYFTVERSPTGEHFAGIASVAGQGTTEERHDYRHQDRHPLPGASYYRLRQTDYDGQFSYSPVRRVVVRSPGQGVSVYPTVLTDQQALYVAGLLPGRYTLRLFDAAGRQLLNRTITVAASAPPVSVPLEGIASGTYLYRLTDQAAEVTSGKLIMR